jgi:hypothetical protein
MKMENLIPGAQPPACHMIALHDGVSRRPDVFLADKFLRQLEKLKETSVKTSLSTIGSHQFSRITLRTQLMRALKRASKHVHI